jgi:hypothetical protein
MGFQKLSRVTIYISFHKWTRGKTQFTFYYNLLIMMNIEIMFKCHMSPWATLVE